MARKKKETAAVEVESKPEASDAEKVIEQTITEKYALYRGDVVEVIPTLPAASVGYSIFSPPFASLYTYSASERDLGNCRSHAEFYEHLSFLAPHLYRITRRGRLMSFHCMDLPTSKERDGFIGIRDFRGLLIRLFQSWAWCDKCNAPSRRPEGSEDDSWKCSCGAEVQGWILHSQVTIWKNPVTAMQRTKALGLLHKTVRGNSSMARQGIPDYVVTMRRPPDVAVEDRVTHDEKAYPVSLWQRMASPIWMDIDAGDTLQRESAREDEDERHICPLQLEVIRRCVELWTNPDDVVFSPFTGIGSEGHVAVKMGRRFVGVELKGSYYEQAVRNLHAAANVGQLSMF